MTAGVEEKPGSGPRRQKVQSAQIGTDILKGLAELSPSTSLSNLAAHVGMPASKVHRYLQALIASGFAEQDPGTGHYCLGREALFVGMAALRSLDVAREALPKLIELRDEFNETCFLAVWGNQGPSVVHVEKPARAITVVTQVGSVLPLLCSSTGLVFSAFLPEADTQHVMQQELTSPMSPTRAELDQQFAQIRSRGMHAIHGLLMTGVNALSAPIFAVGNTVAGVITMVGAEPSFTADLSGPHAEKLLAVTRAISERMNGVMPGSTQ
ncbi:IclR family transcriptional regulator [Marinobacterium maritimum]|uniref:IclR family transcriptional regulator n=1 Tax=Marinobacterium maritimum TaxID=500162 RepID=A0ABN1I2G1_9GAMM